MKRMRGDQSGFTLVELLVAMMLLTLVMGSVLFTLLSAQRSAQSSLRDHDITEESRLALNRMSRELRQSVSITRVVNPDGLGYSPDAVTALTFQADFNGDGCIDGVAPAGFTGTCLPMSSADPEVLSYCHEPAAVAAGVPRLYVLAGALPSGALSSCSGGWPILAEQVSTFQLTYRSSAYRYDSDADGVTTWEELDAAIAPVGNGNGTLDVELDQINSVLLNMGVGTGAGRDFQTQVALRNMA